LKVLRKGFSLPKKNRENIYRNAEGAGQWKSLLNAYTETDHCSIAVRRSQGLPFCLYWENHPNIGAGTRWNMGPGVKDMITNEQH
jgi:hypothetical protein